MTTQSIARKPTDPRPSTSRPHRRQGPHLTPRKYPNSALRRIRLAVNMTLEEEAALAGISTTTAWAAETRGAGSGETWRRLAQALDCNSTDIRPSHAAVAPADGRQLALELEAAR